MNAHWRYLSKKRSVVRFELRLEFLGAVKI
jgi:hypothetical protein